MKAGLSLASMRMVDGIRRYTVPDLAHKSQERSTDGKMG